MLIIVNPAAKAELAETKEWYDDQSAGLGAEFLAEIDAALARIVRATDRFPLAVGDARRAVGQLLPIHHLLPRQDE